MLVICDEIAHMVKRVMGGVSVTDETRFLDMIREVGHRGNFFEHDYTVSHFRQDLFFPVLFQRQTIAQWEEKGAKPIVDVAHERVQEILSQAGPAALPQGADEALARVLRESVREFQESRNNE